VREDEVGEALEALLEEEAMSVDTLDGMTNGH